MFGNQEDKNKKNGFSSCNYAYEAKNYEWIL